MKKFSLILENYNLGRFTISRDQFNIYKREIDSILSNMYIDQMVSIPDFGSFVKPRKFEMSEGRYISILNKVNTNLALLSYFVRQFGLSNFDGVISLVRDRRDDLFSEDGQYLKNIVQIIKSTEEAGEKNEDLAIHYIKSVILSKLGTDITPQKVPTSSYKDLVLGIDIEFTIGGKVYTCQVKPLVKWENKEGSIYVVSSGNIKKYNTDYICFSDWRSKKSILFKNKEVEKKDYNIVSIPVKHLVKI